MKYGRDVESGSTGVIVPLLTPQTEDRQNDEVGSAADVARELV
jgi:hypothetical protein